MDIGIYEAKSRLSQLVEKAESGEEIVLTRRGRPVARIVGVAGSRPPSRKALLRRIGEISRDVRIPAHVTVRELVSEGRD